MIRQKVSGIYKIINTINNKYYVGSSYDIYYRWRKHKEKLNKNKHHSIKLQRSWNRDGKDSFRFTIIEKCDRSLLIEKEQNYLNIAEKNKKDSYNMIFNAIRPPDRFGCKHSCWIKVSNKTKRLLREYWIKNGTMKTLIFAKTRYNIGSKIVCNRLIPSFKKQTDERPERSITDQTIYTFYHKSGKIYTGKRIDFIKQYKLTECCISNMLAGRFKSHNGWSLTKNLSEPDKSGLNNANCDKNLYTIYNIHTQQKITDTRYAIYAIKKILKKEIIYKLIKKKIKKTKDGWIIYDSKQ
jgi:group I intron endonuclease